MGEGGLPAGEVGKEIAAHAGQGAHEHRDRRLSIAEAVLLSVVAVLAAWSGFVASQWSTESRVSLAEAVAARTQAGRAHLEAMELRNFDASTFNAWFAAYTVRNPEAMKLAERRFRPEFKVAFDAWRAMNPESNPDAPKGPTYVREYRQPKLAEAERVNKEADEAFARGTDEGARADDYVRVTVFLAVVLFLVGISAHFPLRSARYGLIAVASVLLVVSLVQLAQLKRPPG